MSYPKFTFGNNFDYFSKEEIIRRLLVFKSKRKNYN